MKITFLMPFAGLAGGNRVIAIYAQTMMERDHEVTVISQPDWRPVTLRNRLKWLISPETRPRPRTPAPWFRELGAAHVMLERPGPPRPEDVPDADILVATWWETAEWVAALPAAKGRKFYLIQGYELFPYVPAERVVATYQTDLHKIAVSQYVRRAILENHRVTGPIDVIHNAVDLKHFDAPPRAKAKQFTVGFIYTHVECKNVMRAIEAVTLARAKLPGLQVLAFGANHPDAAMPLPEWIRFQYNPGQDLLPGLYAQCDLWLFTSDDEGFGLPILEAMACRTPVLATHAGAAPQLIDGRNGTLLPFDSAAFAAEIERFAGLSDQEWQAASQAAYDTAHSYTWDNATDAMLRLFSGKRPHEPPAQADLGNLPV